MGSFKNFTQHLESKYNGGLMKIRHEKKMQVRPIDDDFYVFEIKTKNDKVLLTKSEVIDLMQYIIYTTLK